MDCLAVIALLNLSLTTDQIRACRYLERQGQSFCVHFGYENAVEKAREHWNARRRAKYRRQH